jgi:hypothetical protein
MLSVFMLSVIMLSVIMLSVVAPIVMLFEMRSNVSFSFLTTAVKKGVKKWLNLDKIFVTFSLFFRNKNTFFHLLG